MTVFWIIQAAVALIALYGVWLAVDLRRRRNRARKCRHQGGGQCIHCGLARAYWNTYGTPR